MSSGGNGTPSRGNGTPAPHDSSIRVLHVEDEPDFADLAATMLERERPAISVTAVSDADAGLSALSEAAFDCVVSDFDMPGVDGLEFLSAVRDRHGDLPFVLFTGKGSEEIASEAISAGVTDYLQKGGGREQYAMLANRIENAVERHRAERAVEATRRWHQRLIEESSDVILVVEPDGTIRYLSPSVERVLGYDPGGLVGENAFDYVHPDDRERVEAGHAAVVEGEPDVPRVEFRCEDAEGSWVTLESHSRNLLEDPTIRGIVVYVRDVTRRRARQRELARYGTIVEASGDVVYALDPEGRFTFVNDAYASLTGYAAEEVLGEHVSLTMGDRDIERGEDVIRGLLGDDERSSATFEFDLQTKEGDPIRVENHLALLTDGDGEFIGSTGVLREIAERRERDLELERYEALVEASGDAMYALDADGRYTFVNDALAELGRYGKEGRLGEHVSKVMDEADIERAEALIRELLADDDRQSGTFEMDVVTGDGERVPVENHIAVLPTEEGEFRGTAGVLRDITDRKGREQALKRQNERLDRFASMVSHDLRNPLNVAAGRVQMERQGNDSENLARAEEALTRMSDMVEDVLSLAREGDQVVDPDVVALARCVDGAWATVDAEAATLSVAGDPGRLRADESRLQQLLENLFRNAAEHGGPDVVVRVGRLAGSSDGGDDEGSSPDGFYVEDDGPGVSEADRQRVFEFGETADSGGTGFGLAIVEEITEAHGWTVEVTESASGGARFEVAGVEWVEPA